VPLAPGEMFKAVGEARSVKLGAGAEPVVRVRLSKVAVAWAELEPLFTAKPTYTLVAMEMIWLDPSWVQWLPSEEA